MGPPAPPALTEHRDELQAAPALVRVPGAAPPRLEQRAVPHLAHQRAVAAAAAAGCRRTPCRSALVTSSLTSSSVVSTRSSRPQATQLAAGQFAGLGHRAWAALRAASRRPWSGGQALDAGHQQRDVVLAVRGVEGGQHVVADVLQRPGRAGERGRGRRRGPRPAGGCGTRPGRRCRARAARRRCSSTSISSKGSPPTPSGTPLGSSSSIGSSPGSTTTGGRWPALAMTHRRVTAS